MIANTIPQVSEEEDSFTHSLSDEGSFITPFKHIKNLKGVYSMENTFTVVVTNTNTAESIAHKDVHCIMSNLHGVLISCEDESFQYDKHHVVLIHDMK